MSAQKVKPQLAQLEYQEKYLMLLEVPFQPALALRFFASAQLPLASLQRALPIPNRDYILPPMKWPYNSYLL